MSATHGLVRPEIWDVAIIGGGVGGGVAACHLASHGLKTLVLEKERAPHHKVCGEFVSREGVELLMDLGIDVRKMGAARINSFRLHGPKHTFESKLPQRAMGISRYRLDEEILSRAERLGAEVRRGTMVKEIREFLGSSSRSFALETSTAGVQAKRLVLATGKNDFRSVQKREGRDEDQWVGFKMHLKLRPSRAREIREHCDLFIFEHGYGGIAPIEDGLFNFCFVMEKKSLRKIGADWDALAYHIARNNTAASRYLDSAEPQFEHFATVANVPYGFVQRARPQTGIYCVGDQVAVIPSLTGDGMSIAAMTARAAAYSIADDHGSGRIRPASTSHIYQKEMNKRLRRQIDSAYHLHLLFKNPQLCDWATYAASAFPALVDFIFNRTRVKTDLPKIANVGVKSLRA